jgi:DNA-binding protein YbaB
MSSSLQEQLELTLAEYRRKREDLRGVQKRIAEISASVTSPRNVVSVTVGQHGQVTGVQFPSTAYRSMAPAELAKVVFETVEKAQQKAREELTEMMEPMMPAGLSMRDLVAGKADIDKIFPDDPEDGFLSRRPDQR